APCPCASPYTLVPGPESHPNASDPRRQRRRRAPPVGYTARFLSLRRSRSDSPPQIPKRSSFISAYSRHSPRTSHERQTRLASRVEPPFSGKNASGSVCAHSARSCHINSSALLSSTSSSCTVRLLSPTHSSTLAWYELQRCKRGTSSGMAKLVDDT